MDIITEQNHLKALYNQHNKTYTQVFALFELNYKKILMLIPLLADINSDSIIKTPNQNDLHLLVEETTIYTATFILTHQLNSENGRINRPAIKFRVYFDAGLVEVISVCEKTTLNSNHPYSAQCSDLNIQWELNNFFERWLDYCLGKYQHKLWQTL